MTYSKGIVFSDECKFEHWNDTEALKVLRAEHVAISHVLFLPIFKGAISVDAFGQLTVVNGLCD